MIACLFGFGKQHGAMRRAKHRGLARVARGFPPNLIAYNLIRIPKSAAASPSVTPPGTPSHDRPELSNTADKLKTNAQEPQTSGFSANC